MEFDRDNAKEEVIEYSDLEDHFPADLFQEKEKDMDTNPPMLSGAFSIGATSQPQSSPDVGLKPPRISLI